VSGYGSVLSSSEQGNEPSVVIKGTEFPDHVNYYQLPKYYSAPWSKTVNMKQLSLEKRKNKKLTTQHSQQFQTQLCPLL